ncbi:type III effector [Haloferula helveola]|uniref:Type III effector n=1 Tax=Haloferula helveola TaxID=490095 RepID=A0ABM7RDM2_9BACT|nr:type III effector [Haloferula helveola]
MMLSSVQATAILLSGVFLCALSSCSDEVPGKGNENVQTRASLTEGQSKVLEDLLGKKPAKPAPLFLFTDPNKDPDDLNTLVMLDWLDRQGFVDLRCVVTTLGGFETRERRAKFALWALRNLELEGVKVGIGSDYDIEVRDESGSLNVKATESRKKDHNGFNATPFGLPENGFAKDGASLLQSEIAAVPDGDAVLLVNAGMVDLAGFLKTAPELAKQKVARVVIMGGINSEAEESGFVSADRRAYNNTTVQGAADYSYAKIQELGLPLVVVTKEAAYTAPVGREFYETMAETGHPIGIYLRDQQYESLKRLWTGVHEGHLPPALTPRWFIQTFTELDPDGIKEASLTVEDFDSVWEHVTKFNLYDPMALLAATPGVGDYLFQSGKPEGVSGDVTVISRESIKDPSNAIDAFSALVLESLAP